MVRPDSVVTALARLVKAFDLCRPAALFDAALCLGEKTNKDPIITNTSAMVRRNVKCHPVRIEKFSAGFTLYVGLRHDESSS